MKLDLVTLRQAIRARTMSTLVPVLTVLSDVQMVHVLRLGENVLHETAVQLQPLFDVQTDLAAVMSL